MSLTPDHPTPPAEPVADRPTAEDTTAPDPCASTPEKAVVEAGVEAVVEATGEAEPVANDAAIVVPALSLIHISEPTRPY